MVNRIDTLIDVARELKKRGEERVRIFVYGGGTELSRLQEAVRSEGLSNIAIKGRVDKTFIPYILSKCDLNLMHNSVHPEIFRFGTSLNKTFDYLASGKPTLCNFTFGYDFVTENGCGLCKAFPTVEAYADAILGFYHMGKAEYDAYCENALRTAKLFDYATLTKRYIAAIEGETLPDTARE